MHRSSLQLISAWDAALCLRCNRVSRHRALRVLFRAVSRVGDGALWYGLMGLLLAVDGKAALAAVWRMALAGLLGLLIYKALKARTSRPRPYQVHSAITAAAQALDKFSFPSGHTLHAVGFSVVASTYYPALAPLLAPLALLIALSRPVLGLHYPSDVLAGAAIGWSLAQLVLAL